MAVESVVVEKMVRKQVYLEARQDEELKRRAKASGASEAEFIRLALDRLFREGERDVTLGRIEQPRARILRETATAYVTGDVKAGDEMYESLEKGLEALLGRRSRADQTAWEEEMAFMADRARLSTTETDGVRWTRDDLYDERL